VLVASFAHFCSFDRCNSASSSSVLLNALPRPADPAPGHLQCPTCVTVFGSCPQNSDIVTCPNGTSHCYNGHIAIRGGGISSSMNIQGCVAKPSSFLLNHTQNIGVFTVMENRNQGDERGEDWNNPIIQAGAAPVSAPFLAWVVGLGLSLALWGGAPSLPVLYWSGPCPHWTS
uniref:UPAR/Ly6 domain-containing protein n=1 Tax=Catagonus wagneri TaxID=51154 RepID=A0A8C3W0A1_9CETA